MSSFYDLLRNRRFSGFSEPEVQVILGSVLNQLRPLHHQGKAHQQICLQAMQQHGKEIVLLSGVSTESNPSPSQDIYDLGLVALELLTGRVPSPRRTDPGWNWNDYCLISSHFSTLLEKMITSDPSQRWQNADEVLLAMGVISPKPNDSPRWWYPSRPKLIGASLIVLFSGIVLRYNANVDKVLQENSARRTVGSIISRQEDYFTKIIPPASIDTEIGFAASLEELEETGSFSLRYAEESYEFQSVRENPYAIIITATAREEGLKSLSTAVFVRSGMFFKRSCETQGFSMTAPQIVSAYDVEDECPPGSTTYASSTKSEVTYSPTFIGNAECSADNPNSFKVRFPGNDEILQQGEFKEFIGSYAVHGLLESDDFFLQVNRLRNTLYNCAARVYTSLGECITAGFNVFLQSSDDPNRRLNFAVTGCNPSSEIYVFHSPEDSGMHLINSEVMRSTSGVSESYPTGSTGLGLRDFFKVLMR